MEKWENSIVLKNQGNREKFSGEIVRARCMVWTIISKYRLCINISIFFIFQTADEHEIKIFLLDHKFLHIKFQNVEKTKDIISHTVAFKYTFSIIEYFNQIVIDKQWKLVDNLLRKRRLCDDSRWHSISF